MATNTESPGVQPADADIARVIERIRAWFAERPGGTWLQSELKRRAWCDDIDLEVWMGHPEIQAATGIHGERGRVHDGAVNWFYVLGENPE